MRFAMTTKAKDHEIFDVVAVRFCPRNNVMDDEWLIWLSTDTARSATFMEQLENCLAVDGWSL